MRIHSKLARSSIVSQCPAKTNIDGMRFMITVCRTCPEPGFGFSQIKDRINSGCLPVGVDCSGRPCIINDALDFFAVGEPQVVLILAPQSNLGHLVAILKESDIIRN
jgi:hypothetical protein